MKLWRWMWAGWAALLLGGALRAGESDFNTGSPFGRIGDREVNRLMARAQKDGVDLAGDLRRGYEADDAALGRLAFAPLRGLAPGSAPLVPGRWLFRSTDGHHRG